jgi:hypothetical protein
MQRVNGLGPRDMLVADGKKACLTRKHVITECSFFSNTSLCASNCKLNQRHLQSVKAKIQEKS